MLADDFDQANEYAASALELMRTHKIPPSPSNFQIWYSYVAGRDKDLKRAIDVLISNKVEFTPERNAEIAEQFFDAGRSNKEVKEATIRLQTLANTLIKHVGEAKKGNTEFGERVAGISTDATYVKSTKDIQDLAINLLKEAQSVAQLSTRLEKNLTATSSEISELRSSLVRMQKEAITDSLTGLANRREFMKALKREAVAAGETGTPLSIIFLDVDHFKDFNDKFGHRIGDEVLKVVASKLKLNLKGQDIPARYGGEEFIALLPGTSLKGAEIVAEYVRKSLAASAIKHRVTGESYGKISASFGIATYQVGESLDDFIQRADEALFRAKRDGRNRVERAEDTVLRQTV